MGDDCVASDRDTWGAMVEVFHTIPGVRINLRQRRRPLVKLASGEGRGEARRG